MNKQEAEDALRTAKANLNMMRGGMTDRPELIAEAERDVAAAEADLRNARD